MKVLVFTQEQIYILINLVSSEMFLYSGEIEQQEDIIILNKLKKIMEELINE